MGLETLETERVEIEAPVPLRLPASSRRRNQSARLNEQS